MDFNIVESFAVKGPNYKHDVRFASYDDVMKWKAEDDEAKRSEEEATKMLFERLNYLGLPADRAKSLPTQTIVKIFEHATGVDELNKLKPGK